MNKDEKLRFIEEIMEVENGSLDGTELLSDIDEWDSMSVIGFTTEIRLKYDLIVNINQIREMKTVNDLCKLIPED